MFQAVFSSSWGILFCYLTERRQGHRVWGGAHRGCFVGRNEVVDWEPVAVIFSVQGAHAVRVDAPIVSDGDGRLSGPKWAARVLTVGNADHGADRDAVWGRLDCHQEHLLRDGPRSQAPFSARQFIQRCPLLHDQLRPLARGIRLLVQTYKGILLSTLGKGKKGSQVPSLTKHVYDG